MQPPTLCVHNLLLGAPYIDIGGRTYFTNTKTGEHADLTWTKRGWTGKPYRVSGRAYDATGEPRYDIIGRWNEKAELVNLRTGAVELIWKKKPFHKDADKMYGFTDFLINANYMPKKLERLLPPTDSRRRPD